MACFHEHLKTLIKNSDFDYKRLSLAIGQGERYISNLLSSKSDPGHSSAVKICSALGLTPNQLAGLKDQIDLEGPETDSQIITTHAERILTSVTKEAKRKLSNTRTPLLDDVLTWWYRQKGRLLNFDHLSEYVDLYLSPSDDTELPQPYKVGRQSLFATSFGIETAEHLRHLLTTFDKKLCEKVAMAYVEATHGEPRLSVQEIDVSLPGHEFPLRFVYKRLLLPVQDEKGVEFVLNYSQALE